MILIAFGPDGYISDFVASVAMNTVVADLFLSLLYKYVLMIFLGACFAELNFYIVDHAWVCSLHNTKNTAFNSIKVFLKLLILFFIYFFVCALLRDYSPVLGPCERYMTPILDAALLILTTQKIFMVTVCKRF